MDANPWNLSLSDEVDLAQSLLDEDPILARVANFIYQEDFVLAEAEEVEQSEDNQTDDEPQMSKETQAREQRLQDPNKCSSEKASLVITDKNILTNAYLSKETILNVNDSTDGSSTLSNASPTTTEDPHSPTSVEEESTRGEFSTKEGFSKELGSSTQERSFREEEFSRKEGSSKERFSQEEEPFKEREPAKEEESSRDEEPSKERGSPKEQESSKDEEPPKERGSPKEQEPSKGSSQNQGSSMEEQFPTNKNLTLNEESFKEDYLKEKDTCASSSSSISKESLYVDSSQGNVNPRKDGKGNCASLLCKVCFGPAKGILFYGARVCNSCRIFFARAVRSTMENTCKVIHTFFNF